MTANTINTIENAEMIRSPTHARSFASAASFAMSPSCFVFVARIWIITTPPTQQTAARTWTSFKAS